MKKRMVVGMLGVLLSLGMLTGCAGAEESMVTVQSETGESEGGDRVVLITMDSTDQHWVSLYEAALAEAAEIGGVDFKWMAPDRKDDSQQIEQINNAVADGAQAIMIAPNGPDSVSAALEDAKSQGVHLIYVDAVANVTAEAAFGTDGVRAGEIAAEEMLDALSAAGITSGKIGIVNFSASNQNAKNREVGFRQAMENQPFEILETQYSGGEAGPSQDIADNYISEGAVAIFGANEGCAIGVGNAVKGSGSGIIGIGFDKSNALLAMVEDGSLVCTIAQNPDVMGQEGMKAAVAAIRGEELEFTQLDTGVSVITKDGIEKK